MENNLTNTARSVPRTAAGRQQAADAILTAVKTGRMTPEQARAILNDQQPHLVVPSHCLICF